MNERLNSIKSVVIFMSLALLLSGLSLSIFNEILSNGLFFSLPYLVFIVLGIAILKIETQTKKSLEPQKSFLRLFVSFDSIISLFILAFFSFCEVFLSLEIITFSFDYFLKILNSERQLISMNSHFLIYLGVIYWVFILYVKILVDSSRFRWLKVIRLFVVFFIIALISLIFYEPVIFLEYINRILTEIINESHFYLRPISIWNLRIWQNSAGKVFILIALGYFFYKQWKNQIKRDNTSHKVAIISLSALFSLLGGAIVYFSPQLQAHVSELGYLRSNKLMTALGIAAICLIVFLIFLNILTTSLFEQNRKIDYSLAFSETKYLTQQNILLLLVSLVGLASGFLFIFVEFKDYFYWLGMIFLILLIMSFSIHFMDNYSFNKESKRFNNRFSENQLSSTDKALLQFIIPALLIPLLLISIPDFFSNFLGNKQLNNKIEYLQDLGRITSNHHSLEPYILRDYNKIILDIDSNKVVLDNLDSLKPAQKDSIQLYLENRNYKMNETLRIQNLQYHHDIVFVKNFGKWSLLIFIVSILAFYRFKLRRK